MRVPILLSLSCPLRVVKWRYRLISIGWTCSQLRGKPVPSLERVRHIKMGWGTRRYAPIPSNKVAVVINDKLVVPEPVLANGEWSCRNADYATMRTHRANTKFVPFKCATLYPILSASIDASGILSSCSTQMHFGKACVFSKAWRTSTLVPSVSMLTNSKPPPNWLNIPSSVNC